MLDNKKKKEEKKEVPAKEGNVVDRKYTSKKKPRKPGKFIWLTINRTKFTERTGKK